ncbi:MAG: ABC transporter substrate-binding protein [Desulfatibacillaceae bacterium]
MFNNPGQRKRFRIELIMAAVLAGMFVLEGAAPALHASPGVLATDSLGRTIELPEAARRVVVLGNYRCEAMKVLGCIDRVVGVDGNSAQAVDYYFPELRNQPRVGTWQTPNVEVIASLAPDLVVTSANGARVEKLAGRLDKFGIPVAGFDFYRDDVLAREMRALAALLDAGEQAVRYLAWRTSLEKQLAAFTGAIAPEDRLRVFLEWSPVPGRTYARGSSGQAKCDACGLTNIAAGHPVETPTLSLEWIARQDPDVVFKHVSPWTTWGFTSPAQAEEIIASVGQRPAWGVMTAIRERRIGVLCPEVVWGPDSIVGLIAFTKWAYPDFHLCPRAVYTEYCRLFMNLELPDDLMVMYPRIACKGGEAR